MAREPEHIGSRAGRRFDGPVTDNERFWIEVIRQASGDSDPPPDLHRVRAVRRIFRGAD